MTDFSIRLATVADAPAITEIYNHYVYTSTCTFQIEPDSVEVRKHWLASHGERHPITVAELAGEVVGWGSLSKFRERSGYGVTVEPSAYVRHDSLGRGLGRLLLVDLIERARALGFHTIIGVSCTEQRASIQLQKSLGFVQVAHLQEVGLKFGRRLDVLYFQLKL